jgi:hypothetical protein
VVVLLGGALYIAAYLVNSSLGGYYLTPVADSTRRYPDALGGLGLPLALQWQPKVGFYNNNECTFFGYVFLPMISWDRRDWHKTRYADEPGIFDWVEEIRKKGQIHPRSFEDGRNQRR